MTPFNLEKALAGEPLVCRDGTPATDFSHEPAKDAHGEPDPLDYAFMNISLGEPWKFYCTKGGQTRGAARKDLFMAEVTE